MKFPPADEHSVKRESRFHLVLSSDEREKLTELATRRGVSEATIVRDLVRREHERTESRRKVRGAS